ncbi:molybdopterin-dependent oxidoreductase [Phycicoccus sp. MQZ13P-5]|uniref:Molybdopterin-dependent oxidoreductase n=1 Tax=Phycicoccus sonneratiae TaxID=2807628 RepID=A0ABS2CQW1_9MICO|nr:molybdopterin-dependent oxidoreductase [Phycicoccus sonneraticus]
MRGERTTAHVGVWLGVAFAVAFATGLYSHAAQLATPPLALPAAPSRLYQVTQGLHVAAGTAAVPLLLVKLWSVFPRLFVRPPGRPRALAVHLLERGSVALLVGSAVFQLVTGLANSAQWYPWSFGFVGAHYALAWVAAGSVVLHVAVKLPVVRRALGEPVERTAAGTGPSRRTLLGATWLSAAIAVVATSAAEVPGLRRVALLAVRSGEGPQGVPVNRSAVGAAVAGLLDDPAWRLRVVGPGGAVELSIADLEAMPQHGADLPIACVEGWSASGRWGGVRVRDVAALVGGGPGDDVVVRSLQTRGAYRESRLPANFVQHPDSLLALRLAGEPLHPDHGRPCRLIAPGRPGVLQTKWVREVQVVTT